MTDLAAKRCKPCEAGVPPLSPESARELLKDLDGWEIAAGGREIRRSFSFREFHRTMAFVNAVAWIAHRENHHPDLEVGFDRCLVRYTTHAIRGLSENDFICAAKIDGLWKEA